MKDSGPYAELIKGSQSNLQDLVAQYEADMDTMQQGHGGTVGADVSGDVAVEDIGNSGELEALDPSVPLNRTTSSIDAMDLPASPRLSLSSSLNKDGTHSGRISLEASADVSSPTSDVAARAGGGLSQKSLHASVRHEYGKGRLITEEGRETGNVAKAIYVTYLRAAGGNTMIVLVMLTAALASILPVLSQYWISVWTEDRYAWSQIHYLDVFAIVNVASVMTFFLRGAIICVASTRAAKVIHGRVVDSLLAAPLSFFHTTPQGRIMNRCSSDMETSDEMAGPMMANFLNQLTTMAASVVSIVLMSYWFGLVIPIVAYLYLLVARYYVASSRELKRLASVYKSPVFKHFSEALEGAVTIRAYGDVDRFVTINTQHLDLWMKAWWPSVIVNRWLSLRLDLIGGFMTVGAAFAVLVVCDLPLGGLHMNAGKAGFAISQTLAITSFLGFTVMIYGQLEMTAIASE